MQFVIPTLKRKKTPKTKLIKEDYRIYSINRPGARFSKVPVTLRARNQTFKSKYKE